jgi:hypothetical protein
VAGAAVVAGTAVVATPEVVVASVVGADDALDGVVGGMDDAAVATAPPVVDDEHPATIRTVTAAPARKTERRRFGVTSAAVRRSRRQARRTRVVDVAGVIFVTGY